MPEWIPRTLEASLSPESPQLKLFPIWLLLGPRQVGKSSLLLHCNKDRMYVNLDDIQVRQQAVRNPALFAKSLELPLIIDEIQYAPQLLSPLKILADKYREPGSIWLTGSQNFQVMEGVTETLAGRVAILNLFGLTDKEKGLTDLHPLAWFSTLLSGNFPVLVGEEDSLTREAYFSNYARTYIERDIRELLRIEKRREFEIFVKMCALRTGQILNYEGIARDSGVSAVTIKEWVSLLEDSFQILLVHPWYPNRNKRLIKSPKLYFLDMGLAAYLAGWRTAEQLLYGPMAGPTLETHLVSNLYRTLKHRIRDCGFHFWRTRDGQEIDLLVELGGKTWPIEIKFQAPDVRDLVGKSVFKQQSWERGTVLSPSGAAKPRALNEVWDLVHPFSFQLE